VSQERKRRPADHDCGYALIFGGTLVTSNEPKLARIGMLRIEIGLTSERRR
jgi:hypothetical protein